MRSVRTYVFFAAFILLVITPTTQGQATDPTTLPDFELTALDGKVVKTSDLPLSGKWLLIYVRPHCQACLSVLRLLKKNPDPAANRQIVIVVGGTAEEAKDMAQRFPKLADTLWYADPSENTVAQLKLPGAPVVIGIRQKIVEWSFNGAPASSQELRSMVTTWIKE